MNRFTALLLVFLTALSCGIPALTDEAGKAPEQTGFMLTRPGAASPAGTEAPEEASAAGTEAPEEASAAAAVENSEGVYRVIVLDDEGAAVEGAMVLFCDDSVCMAGQTDGAGTAAFPDAQAGHPYTVHLLKVPEGYEPNTEEYESLDTFCDIYIILRKAV